MAWPDFAHSAILTGLTKECDMSFVVVRRVVLAGMVSLSLAFLAAAPARADEEPKPLELNQVPKAVMNAVLKKYPDAKPQSASQGVENDKPYIDVHVLVKSQKIWVTCEPNGTIREIDKEITIKELPAPVSAALQKKYPQATIRLLNEITADSAPVYDIALTFQKKPLIAIFAASGEFLEEIPDGP
jgi:hypothetical protein